MTLRPDINRLMERVTRFAVNGKTGDALEHRWKERAGIDDDTIFAIFPRYGIAEHSACIAGYVDFNENTSWQR